MAGFTRMPCGNEVGDRPKISHGGSALVIITWRETLWTLALCLRQPVCRSGDLRPKTRLSFPYFKLRQRRSVALQADTPKASGLICILGRHQDAETNAGAGFSKSLPGFARRRPVRRSR